MMVNQVLERWVPGTHSVRGRPPLHVHRSSVLEEAHEVRTGLAIGIRLMAIPRAPPSVSAGPVWGPPLK